MRSLNIALVIIASALIILLVQPQPASAASITVKCSQSGPLACQATACVSLGDVTGLLSKLEKLFGSLSNLLNPSNFGNLLNDLEKAIGNLANGAYKSAINAMSKAFDFLTNLFQPALLNTIGKSISELMSRLLSEVNIMGALNNLAGALANGISQLVGHLSGLGGLVTLPQTLLNGIENLLTAISSELSQLLSEIQNALANLVRQISDIVNSSNSIVSNGITIKASLVNVCTSSKSVLKQATNVCELLAQYEADLKRLQAELQGILPLTNAIVNSASSLPANIISLQNVAMSRVQPELSGQISACIVPSGTLNAGVQIVGLTSSVGVLTGELGTVATKLTGYSFAGTTSNTVSGSVSGIMVGTMPDESQVMFPVTGSASLQFSAAALGPVSVTPSNTFSGQVLVTLSGSLTGTVSGTVPLSPSQHFTGALTGAISGTQFVATESGSFTTVNGVIEVTSSSITFSNEPILIAGSNVQGTAGTNTIYGTLVDYASLTLSAYSNAKVVDISGGSDQNNAALSVSGTFQTDSPSLSEGLLVAIGNLNNDINAIAASITTPCNLGYAVIATQRVNLDPIDTATCTNVMNARGSVASETLKVVGAVGSVTAGPVNTAIVDLNRLALNITRRYGAITNMIHINPTVKVPSSISGPVSSDISQLSGALGDAANSISGPANDLALLSSNIIALGKPVANLAYSVGVAGSAIGNVINLQPPQISSAAATAIKALGTGCAINVQGYVDKALNTNIGHAVCDIYYAFFSDASQVRYDVNVIHNNLTDIYYYDVAAGAYVLALQSDMHAVQMNMSHISTNLTSIGGIIHNQDITGQQCMILSQDIVNVQAGSSNLFNLITSPYGIQFEINAFIDNVAAASRAIPQDVTNIVNAIEDIINTVQSFIQSIMNAGASTTQSNLPIPIPGICISVAYIAQSTSYLGYAGYGCVLDATNLLVPVRLSAVFSINPTLTATSVSTSTVQAQLTGNTTDSSGNRLQVSGTVPVTLSSGATAQLSGQLTGVLVGAVSVPYSLTGLRAQGILSGTVTGIVSARDWSGVSGTIGTGAAATATGGSAGTGASGSVAGGFTATVSDGASYTVSGTVTVSVTCSLPIINNGKLSISTTIKNSDCQATIVSSHISVVQSSSMSGVRVHGVIGSGSFFRNGISNPLTGFVDMNVTPAVLSLKVDNADLSTFVPEITSVQASVQDFNPVNALVGSCSLKGILSVWPSFGGQLAGGPPTPEKITVSRGQSVLLTANPYGGTPPYAIQWYYGSTSSSCDIPILGAVQPTYMASPLYTTYYCYSVRDVVAKSPVMSVPSEVVVP